MQQHSFFRNLPLYSIPNDFRLSVENCSLIIDTKEKFTFFLSEVPWEVVNLDLPPEQRYNDLVGKKIKEVGDMESNCATWTVECC